MRQGFQINRNIRFEIFIHKIDGFPDERKIEIHHEIQQQISEILLQDGNESIVQKIYLRSEYASVLLALFSIFFLS